MERKQYMANWRAGQKAKGLCTRCDEPAVEGRVFCPKHLEETRRRSANNVLKSKANRVCSRCHQHPAMHKRNFCAECLESNREQVKQKRLQKLLTGLCCCSGCNNAIVSGKKHCQYHLAEMVKKNQLKWLRRKNAGLCRDCPLPAIPGRRACENCWLKQCSRTNFGTTDRWEDLKALFEMNPVCPYTGKKLTLGINASLDHRVPRGRGGSDDLMNLEWVFYGYKQRYDVNRMKGHMLPEEYKAALVEQYIYTVTGYPVEASDN